SSSLVSFPASPYPSVFFFHDSLAHRVLPPFPTRRSSDLQPDAARGQPLAGAGSLKISASATANPISAGGVTTLVIGITNDRSVPDRKSTRLNSSHVSISYAVFCLKKKKTKHITIKILTHQ